jgi:hypothetical protein
MLFPVELAKKNGEMSLSLAIEELMEKFRLNFHGKLCQKIN